MAYNREWDKGKQADYSSWQPGPRGNPSMYDEDYHGDSKRRKYNDGGYDAFQGYDDSYDGGHQSYDQGGYYHDDRHQKGGGGGGGGMHRKRLVPSEPSPHVIFLGLDPDFTESDMQAYLTSNSCSIESVTVIRDRSTGVSKGFGFAQFTSTEHARAFVDPLFPFIQIPPPASHGASARAAFYRAFEAGSPAPPGGRRVKIDYSQSAAPQDRRGPKGGPFQANDGTRDIGSAQAPVLLFRGLDPLSGPQAIAQAMRTSAGPAKEGARGMRRIILVKDKTTGASWGFAFVEFVDVESASAVLASTMSPQLHPNGFRISDRSVAASFAHPYSFQPLPEYSLRDDACVMGSATLGGTEGVQVRYWDEASTAAILEFAVEEPVKSAHAAPVVKEKKEKRKKETTSQEVSAEASTLPVSDKPVTLSFKGGFGLAVNKPGQMGQAKKPVPISQVFSMDDAAEGGADETTNETTTAEDPKVAASKRVAPLIASKKTVNNINKWNQVQDVLHHDAPQEVPVTQPVEAPAPVTPVQPVKVKAVTPPEAENEFEFSDTSALTCLLCARQFKTLEQLKRHNKESDLHKKNYKDAALREVAREKAQAARAKVEQQQPKYRDRASERRVMHNQPEVPRPSPTERPANKPRQSEGPRAPSPPPPPPPNPGQDDLNIGNKLLKMMGWKEGQGLGTEGEGRVDPIQTAIYAAGAGLGASKAKDITKFASDYTGYVNLAKDAARERYEG